MDRREIERELEEIDRELGRLTTRRRVLVLQDEEYRRYVDRCEARERTVRGIWRYWELTDRKAEIEVGMPIDEIGGMTYRRDNREEYEGIVRELGLD